MSVLLWETPFGESNNQEEINHLGAFEVQVAWVSYLQVHERELGSVRFWWWVC